jgi:hypothetical protein
MNINKIGHAYGILEISSVLSPDLERSGKIIAHAHGIFWSS